MTPNPSWLFRSLCLLGTLAWPLAAPAQPGDDGDSLDEPSLAQAAGALRLVAG